MLTTVTLTLLEGLLTTLELFALTLLLALPLGLVISFEIGRASCRERVYREV